jgi:hypothetical protein
LQTVQITSTPAKLGINATLAIRPTAAATATSRPTETLPPFQSIAGLPADIPVLPQNYGDLTTSSSNTMSSYIFTTWLPLNQAAEYYRKAMIDKGWVIVNTTTSATPPSTIYSFGKNNNQRMVNIKVMTPNPDQHTMIILMLIGSQ